MNVCGDLISWGKVHHLTLRVLRISSDFPQDEFYGLTSQMLRANMFHASIPAQGHGRGSDPGFAKFLQIAVRRASITIYRFLLAHDLGLMNDERHQELNRKIPEIMSMAVSLTTKLRSVLSGICPKMSRDALKADGSQAES